MLEITSQSLQISKVFRGGMPQHLLTLYTTNTSIFSLRTTPAATVALTVPLDALLATPP